MNTFLRVYKDECCIADQVEQGNTFFKRLMGLMGRRSLAENQGFYLSPCRSIHTFQMRFPIDVLFLSKEGTVVDIAREIPPWKTKSAAKNAYSTLELAAKTAEKRGIAIGDKLVIQ